MAQPIFPSDSELDEKPQAMLFDGWGFVPLVDTEATVPAAEPEGEAA